MAACFALPILTSKCTVANSRTSQIDEGLSPAQRVGGVARVVGEVLLLDLPDDERVLAAAALHVPLAVGVEPHGLAVPHDVGRRVGVHDARQLGRECHPTQDYRPLCSHLGLIWKKGLRKSSGFDVGVSLKSCPGFDSRRSQEFFTLDVAEIY